MKSQLYEQFLQFVEVCFNMMYMLISFPELLAGQPQGLLLVVNFIPQLFDKAF
jgi:hypothetical protein